MREVEILKKKQLKCYIYTRVSTSMQVDGYSLDAQRDKLRKYAAYEDMVIAGEYSDEGFSGKNIQGRQNIRRISAESGQLKDQHIGNAVLAGFRCQSDLRGGWHRQFKGCRKADDFRAVCGGRNRAREYPHPDNGRT